MNRVLKRYTKQLVILFVLIISTVIGASFITKTQLSDSLSNVYLNKLTVLRSSLKVNIEKYFDTKSDIIKTISQTSDIKNAMEDFTNAFNNISNDYRKKVDNKKLISFIEQHKKRTFYNIKNAPEEKPSNFYIPSNINGNILQNLYVANNPFESSKKYMFFNSSKNISYDKIHKQYHQRFVDDLKRHNFYDIFLIDNDGNIVYSVLKELDLGTNLKYGKYSKSSLAIAYNDAIRTSKFSFSDFHPYEPSYNKPVAFFAIPIKKAGKNIGVVAFQISITEINNIMTFNENWKDIGLGDSGEAYLVGNDYFMRSDSRFMSNMESKLVNDLATTVGIVNVKSKATQAALSGEFGQGVVKDYRDIDVLSSYAPINILGNTWALAVEIDKSEIDRDIEKIIATILATAIIMVILFMIFLGYILLRLIINPIENFEKELNKKVDEKTKELKDSSAILDDYKKAVDKASIVSKTDTKGIIKYVNDAFCEISGFTKEELIGQPHNIVRHPDSPKAVFEEIWRTIKNKRVWQGVIKNRKKNGGDYIVKSTIVPILDDDNNITEFISIRTDIGELINKEKKIVEQTTDEITKLPNRIKLKEDISENKKDMKLAIIQINSFKEINDFYGVDKANLVLISLTSILQRIVATNSIDIYKVDFGEFALLSKADKPMEEFVKTVQNIIKYYDHNVIVVGSDSFNISVSVGIAKEDENKILFNSEMALTKAVESSKSLVIYENDIEKEYENNVIMTKKIKEAIKNDHILVYAQPIKTNYKSGKSKYECLVRMYDKEQDKVLAPFFFLDIAKKARLYPTLTKIIIEKSFEYFCNKKDEFSINLSIEDILSDDIVIFLKRKIDYFKIGDRVVLELVESEGIENFDDVHAFIKEFKGYGCKIAIDDFGTGYSNFEYLMKLDIDYLKIDGSLIKDIDTNQNSQRIVELMVDFSKKMDVKTIAEFIHNDSVYKKIKSMGIDYSQGYHLGKPVELEKIV